MIISKIRSHFTSFHHFSVLSAIRKNFSSKIGPAAELESRELLCQSTNELLKKDLFFTHCEKIFSSDNSEIQRIGKNKPISAYAGFDPTADSLHMGNLISILTMVRLSLIGIRPILLVGGATGLIGDPSGKTSERNMLSRDEVNKNVEGIENTLRKCVTNIYGYLEKHKNEFQISGQIPKAEDVLILNNYTFYQNMNILDFIRDVGKYFRMGTLLSKETVANRIASEDGLSFTEFTYTLLQGYDFEQLLLNENCIIQVGGSDQWGNITSGIELIRRKHRTEVFGITTNLVLTANGKKFGKSEGNALWLDSTKTKPYDIHQYLINIPDALAFKYLKMFTFLPLHQLQEIEKRHMENPGNRLAQNILVSHIIGMVQGQVSSNDEQGVKNTATKFFSTDFSRFVIILDFQKIDNCKNYQKEKSDEEIEQFFSSLTDRYIIDRSVLNKCKNYVDLVAELKLLKTKAETKRNLEKGGAYLNNERISSEQSDNLPALLEKYLLANKYLVVRFGKKSYFLIEVI